MRTIPILPNYELVVLADEPDGVIGDIRHAAARYGALVYTPIAHFSAIPDKAQPEQPARWRVELFLRNDVTYDQSTGGIKVDPDANPWAVHYNPDLPQALADVLLKETVCTKPLLVNIWEGRMTDYVARGQIFDED